MLFLMLYTLYVLLLFSSTLFAIFHRSWNKSSLPNKNQFFGSLMLPLKFETTVYFKISSNENVTPQNNLTFFV